jgi:hypothetical protein
VQGTNGKFAIAGGLTEFRMGVLVLSTSKARYNDVSEEQLANAVTIGRFGDLEKVKNIHKDDLVLPLVDPKVKDAYSRAYKDSGMKAFDFNHPYRSIEEQIHGIGAHEEVHLLNPQNIKYQEKDDIYNMEKQALEMEIKARKEYINENP